MNEFSTIPAQITLGATLVCAYTVYVASECGRNLRRADKTLRAGALIGPGAAVGTGLWAVMVLALSTQWGEADDRIGWGLMAAAWLAAVGCAMALLRGAVRWSAREPRSWLRLASAAVLLAVAAALIQAASGHLAWGAPDLARIGAVSVAASGALIAVLALQRDSARGGGSALLRVLLVAAAIALLVAAGTPGIGIAGAGGKSTLTPFAVLVTLIVAAAALIVLTMTRLTVRIERRLNERARSLSTSLHVANANLRALAYRDPLTRLANRLMFERKLASAVAAAEARECRIALLYIDLDGFKPINDGYGHAMGDRVLREVGDRLRGVAPKGSIVARLGGDEFVLLTRDATTKGESSALAIQIIGAISPPIDVDGERLAVSCSIGIAAYPDSGGGDKLLAAGDAAMYAAKRAGGSTFAFHDGQASVNVELNTELMRELRHAVSGGQFELYYQPKVNARGSKVASVEALLRWNHPTRGVISPAVFIPLCERIGLIGQVGDWVLDQACRQIKQWQDKGLRMRVAVNISAQQLRRPGLVQRIETLIKAHGVLPDQLTCEITESTAMCDLGQAHRTLMRIGRLGVRVAIDDFGTGHSSLAYLRQLPASEIKIDRGFVSDIGTSKDARAIVQAVIQMAHALELTVVAEGVETEDQRQILLGMGCDQFQGYLFSKPLPAATLMRWAMTERPAPRTFSESLFMRSLLAPLN
jgi:diguanylate cyclase